jgi:signal transduction histidine kinase
MLESVPMLFGLVPAQVRETSCSYKGDPHCSFELRWSRSPRTGLVVGAALGAALAAGLGAGSFFGALPLWLGVVAGLLLPLLAAGAGRSIDLTRQLEAVAGSRRGQLALLEQLDDSLAEKLDELAKVGGTDAGPAPTGELQGLVPVQRSGSDSGEPDDTTHAAEAAVGIHSAVIELRRDLGNLYGAIRDGSNAEDAGVRELFRNCAAHGRRIEELSAELERRTGGFDGPDSEVSAIAPIVDCALAGLRPELPSSVTIDIRLASDVSPVFCDPLQIEFVVEQLVRNAADAIDEKGIIHIGIAESPAGVQLTVEDDGDGMEHHTVDEVFDPFFDETVAGQNASFGLPVCYRIIEEHGGELHVQSGEGHGTRVTVVLPTAPLGV